MIKFLLYCSLCQDNMLADSDDETVGHTQSTVSTSDKIFLFS